MKENIDKTYIESEIDDTPHIEDAARELGIDAQSLTEAILWGFLFSYNEIKQPLKEILKHAKPKRDAVKSFIAEALYHYAKIHQQKIIDYLLDTLKCKGHYILLDVDYDLEGYGRYELKFASIEGTPYLVDVFTVTKHNEDEYDLITETYLPDEKLEERIAEYIEENRRKIEEILSNELIYELEYGTLKLTFYGEWIDEFPTIPQLSKSIKIILKNIYKSSNKK